MYIGGGTTKIALVEGGRVVHTAAIHIGGRLAVVEPGHSRFGGNDLVLTRLDPAGKQLAKNAGLDWSVGCAATDAAIEQLTEWMADALIAALTAAAPPAAVRALWLTEPFDLVQGIAGVMFSGGVAEYVYGREARDFGDLGPRLGAAIRRRIDAGALPWALLPAGECIRATAIGASEYSVQLSGNTVYVSNPGALLPRKNLQVLQPYISLAGEIDAARVSQAIRRHFEAFDLVEGEADVALAFRWEGPPAYRRLAALARGIVEALPMTLLGTRALYLGLEGAVAQRRDGVLRGAWGVASEVLVIDGGFALDFDYVDWGACACPRTRCRSRSSRCLQRDLRRSGDSAGAPMPRPRHAGHDHEQSTSHGHHTMSRRTQAA